ncbi:hypothetical protein AB0L53_12350 [Nonomuraea sp. NPDC052129]|uniref:hypothetical protein n=1 Tax=Nonomuraea sp. NPDC052129 TaxID=3154651 RepID=UPI0034204915
MGDKTEGYEVIPPDLKKAMETCAHQAPIVRNAMISFAPAKLHKSDFGLAPGADELGAAYVDGTAENEHKDKRYESVYGYLGDLADALEFISTALEVSAYNYKAAHQASDVGGPR